jgi:cell division protein FtsL
VERKTRVAGQRRIAGSVVWIGIVAVLLAGVVAVNVAVLRLNVRLDQASRDRAQLRADDAALQSELASAAASLRIEQAAQSRFGLVPADQAHTTYVSIAPRAGR